MTGGGPVDREGMASRLREIDAARALGAVVTVDPDEADELGLFEETALSLEDALAARFDWDGPPIGAGVAIPGASAAEAGLRDGAADAADGDFSEEEDREDG